MPSLKSLLLGEEAFGNCSHVVFESEYIQPIAPRLITAETILRPNYVTISLNTYLFKTLLTFHMR